MVSQNNSYKNVYLTYWLKSKHWTLLRKITRRLNIAAKGNGYHCFPSRSWELFLCINNALPWIVYDMSIPAKVSQPNSAYLKFPSSYLCVFVLLSFFGWNKQQCRTPKPRAHRQYDHRAPVWNQYRDFNGSLYPDDNKQHLLETVLWWNRSKGRTGRPWKASG